MAFLLCSPQTSLGKSTPSPQKTASGDFFVDELFYAAEIEPEPLNNGGWRWPSATEIASDHALYVINDPVNAVDPLGLELTVLAISEYTVEEDRAAWMAFPLSIDARRGGVSSNWDLITYLEAVVRVEGEKIDTLALSGHGFVGGLSWGDGVAPFSAAGLTPAEVVRLQAVMKSGGRIEFYSCNAAGADGDGLQDLSDLLWLILVGSNSPVSAGPDSYNPVQSVIQSLQYWLNPSSNPWVETIPGTGSE